MCFGSLSMDRFELKFLNRSYHRAQMSDQNPFKRMIISNNQDPFHIMIFFQTIRILLISCFFQSIRIPLIPRILFSKIRIFLISWLFFFFKQSRSHHYHDFFFFKQSGSLQERDFCFQTIRIPLISWFFLTIKIPSLSWFIFFKQSGSL